MVADNFFLLTLLLANDMMINKGLVRVLINIKSGVMLYAY
jgi:hypothetical protein